MPREGPWFESTHPNAPASLASGPALQLLVVHPPEVAGLRFSLTPASIFGRAPGPEIACIPHVTISRRHAGVRIGLGGIPCLEDLESRNGSKVNGARLELPAPLQPQSVIRFGDVHAVVDFASERRFGQDQFLPGTSALAAETRRKLDESAGTAASVLVIGETGTGKERLAHEVHRRSGRTGRYVTLNCAELSPQLIESQLFGHDRGAFTGATSSKVGLFAAAHGGTLFLDEIGELPLELQPKLLRVLQEGELRRVGSVETDRVDVRVVAATNRDLPALVETGAFRRDLYARLAFHELRLPSMREARQDLLAWLSLLTSRYAAERGARHELELAPDAVERLLLHAWPDNLRGLDRLVHRLASHVGPVGRRALLQAMPELRLPGDEQVAPEYSVSPLAHTSSAPPPRALSQPPSREEFVAAYEACGKSIRGTAKHFNKDRRQIQRWLERFGIQRESEPE